MAISLASTNGIRSIINFYVPTLFWILLKHVHNYRFLLTNNWLNYCECLTHVVICWCETSVGISKIYDDRSFVGTRKRRQHYTSGLYSEFSRKEAGYLFYKCLIFPYAKKMNMLDRKIHVCLAKNYTRIQYIIFSLVHLIVEHDDDDHRGKWAFINKNLLPFNAISSFIPSYYICTCARIIM